ncbi:MAG: hypothetical protein KVP17_004321 [Porospora cf. gigantea B]|nr:MAG: hypothetical protein KVP17_004321 [Porospora cf. gigantea B]
MSVIYPPPQLRAVIDKTAQFVAKNGLQFEQRVLREQSQQKFAFLLPDNPFRAYYDLRVKDYKDGTTGDANPSVPQAILDMKARAEERKSQEQKKAKALMLTEYGEQEIKPPSADMFSIKHPYLAAVDMDVIKLTAQFVARNGQRLLVGLTQREKSNPQFDFLKPSHSLFPYFTSLVESYARCLMPDKSLLEKIKANYTQTLENDEIRRTAFHRTLDRCHNRYRWTDQEDRKRKKEETRREEERAQLSGVDWHDFSVVESILFTEEDMQAMLPAPVDLAKRTDQQFLALTAESLPAPIDTVLSPQLPVRSDVPEDEVPLPIAPKEGNMTIRRNYVRRSRKSFGDHFKNGLKMQTCPLTGQPVPASDMSEHLRNVLLDPQWKAQKNKMIEQAKKEAAFAPHQDLEDNLAQFVVRRPDLFGTIDDELLEVDTTEPKNKRRRV